MSNINDKKQLVPYFSAHKASVYKIVSNQESIPSTSYIMLPFQQFGAPLTKKYLTDLIIKDFFRNKSFNSDEQQRIDGLHLKFTV